MSIFSDVKFGEGSDDPFNLGLGTHTVTISDAVVERASTGTLGLWITFSDKDGKAIRKWVTMPEEGQAEDVYQRNVSFLRLFLKNLEIPESKWETMKADDFISIDCVITVTPQKKKPEFNQVGKITRAKGTPMQKSTVGAGTGFAQHTVSGDFKF